MKEFYDELNKGIIRKNLDVNGILKLRTELGKKYKIKHLPTLIEIFLNFPENKINKLKGLISKPTRTISGVAPIAIMTKPFKCPHGKCAICPGGINSYFGDVPQSYTGREPATLRAIRNNYDPYLQVFNRLEQYLVLGHIPDKVELILMGGTFPSLDKKYQDEFVTYALKAMNDFSTLFFKKGNMDIKKLKSFFEIPSNIHNPSRISRIKLKIKKLKSRSTLEKEQKRNEKAFIRCVGLTIETRPDYALLEHANQMLRLGATRVELGVQSVYDAPLKEIERGHTVKDSIKAIKILKNLGFKLNFHYMIGLPKTTPRQDIEGLKKLFEDSDFQPDMLKIYPCLVLKGTKLYEKYKKNKYCPLTTIQAIKIISEFKKIVPEYVRIMRVQRDIPTKVTEAGPDRNNLRQYVTEELKKKGIFCKCIRCREIKNKIPKKTHLRIISYNASKGKEFFLSIVDSENSLIGFLRLRFPSAFLRKEITKTSALVRELHVYSPITQIGKKSEKSQQHKGYGKILLNEAEKISRLNNKTKMVIISGIGVREYYKKQGYKKEGPYMVKVLK
ncbi:MAG: tRNA uridine(34) 5-carboxymethylaminomethyl modification radical SAM/GNAT enzyme Elp3 [Candidatus Nanoarchaeia archaeon]|nr:tRNA uridine(34) 5-carboxymethylaminomethyl modification radical SAM/GNAT enzyme Elp3 [Candidatus Nanoarchaeia archaeon]